MYSILHYKIIPHELLSTAGAHVLILATIVLQVVRKLIHQIHAKCFSSEATRWWNMKGLIPTKDDFSLPWHDKILLTLDLIYASILCVFVNNAMQVCIY
jgi:hypothetical protein